MKAKGIMVGNYHETENIRHARRGINSVLVDGKAFSAISAYGICRVNEGKDDFIPLPLTETWLTLFGFEKGEPAEEFTEWHDGKTFILMNEKEGYHYPYGSDIHINHVHELQNLYFALSGEELKLK